MLSSSVNGTQRKTVAKLLADPANGNLEWSRIESLLQAAGCKVVESHRFRQYPPAPAKEALRYRVLAVREFIERMGIEP